jgi:hypothetical protein
LRSETYPAEQREGAPGQGADQQSGQAQSGSSDSGIHFSSSPKPCFCDCFCSAENHHDELLVEKCTELGAQRFFPLDTRYSVRNPGKNTVSRFAKVALAAIKQCDNPWLPVVEQSAPLETALQLCRQQVLRP